MTKPVFGKWTSTKDALPEFEVQCSGNAFVFVIAKMPDGYTSEMEYNSKGEWRACGCPVHEDNITHWMPLPKAGQDAFTELRALLEEAEKDNREKYPDESMMKFILERMREVIE